MSEPGPEKTRRIVQIAAAGNAQRDDTVLALCSDSTVWLLVWGEKQGDERWARIVDIPQD